MANDDLKISGVKTSETSYMSPLEKFNKKLEEELAAKASHQNPGGQGPSIYIGYTRTNSVSGDNGENATCFYS